MLVTAGWCSPVSTPMNNELFTIISTCKGGGYCYARTEPRHPKANAKGCYPLHRVLMENMLGRLLEPYEDVHHKDHDKFNNDVSNLEVLPHATHAATHHPKATLMQVSCGNCGEIISLKPHQYRVRTKRARQGELTCSHKCSGQLQHYRNGASPAL